MSNAPTLFISDLHLDASRPETTALFFDFLARRARVGKDVGETGDDWPELAHLLVEFWQRVRARLQARHAPGRLKAWLCLLRRTYPQADDLYLRIRACNDPDTVGAALAAVVGRG